MNEPAASMVKSIQEWALTLPELPPYMEWELTSNVMRGALLGEEVSIHYTAKPVLKDRGTFA